LLLCCVALAVVALPVQAEQTLTSTELLIRLTVRPAPEPKPALRYMLLPELKEMTPGNPIPNYLKGVLDQDFTLPQEVLRPSALRMADQAARMDRPDWQILLKVKTDGIGLLIPDVQKIRALAAGLQGRFRDENSKRRFDDSIRTAKTMFAMSRHMSEHPTLIGDLVGIAIAAIAIEPMEEMLEQPGSPNLYWALTNLPSPMVPLDKGLEGERVLINSELKELSDTAPMSAEQIRKLVEHIDKLREFEANAKPKKSTRAILNARKKDEKFLQGARERLFESGLSEERLRTFPAEQVLLLDERLAYEIGRDAVMKLMKLPAWQIEARYGQIKKPGGETLFSFLIPAVIKVRRAQSRLDQRISLLRHVEALRLYAAENDGKLPAKLSDFSVPLPNDPFSGKSFRYEVEGNTAHIRGTPPAGEAKQPYYNVHYQIIVRK
jgi:hypothetical protein